MELGEELVAAIIVAPQFLEAGASVFIDTLWSVNTKTALKFVRVL